MGPSTSVVCERTACALATRITQQIVEVLIGRRSLNQIRDRLSIPVANLLATGMGWTTSTRTQYRLHSVHACLTTRSRVEACAVVGNANRARAFVLRLERRNMEWACTMLSVL